MESLKTEYEKELEQRVCNHFLADFIAVKFGDGSHSGAPDRLFVCPGGVVVFAEFKQPGEPPGPHQEFYHSVLRRLGHVVFVFDDFDTAVAVLGTYVTKVEQSNFTKEIRKNETIN